MSNESIFDLFNSMNEKDLKCLVSIGIEFLVKNFNSYNDCIMLPLIETTLSFFWISDFLNLVLFLSLHY